MLCGCSWQPLVTQGSLQHLIGTQTHQLKQQASQMQQQQDLIDQLRSELQQEASSPSICSSPKVAVEDSAAR